MHFPLTIWRQAMVEMWKLFLVTTAVLVTVVSFALTVKFFAEGRLGPIETLHFMVLAMVPMLQYTVPFAACFAATLTYHRMAADNEILAAQAGGISHRSVLMPAFLSGLVLAGMISLLTEQIVPRFLWKMDDLVSQKVAKLVMTSIQKRQPIQQNGVTLYADEVSEAEPDRAGGASDAMMLYGIVLAKFDESGRAQFEASARRALVQVYPRRPAGGRAVAAADQESSTLVVAVLKDATLKKDGNVSQLGEYRHALVISGGFDDDPKFFTWGGMRALRHEPERLNFLDRMRRNLAYCLGERAACDAIRGALRVEGRAVLVSPAGDRYVINARDMSYGPSSRPGGENRWELTPSPGRPLTVDCVRAGPEGQRAGGPVMQYVARAGGILTNMGDPSAIRLSLTIELEDAAAALGGERAGELAQQTIVGLAAAEDPLPELLGKSSAELLAIAEPRTTGRNADAFLKPPTRDLRDRIDRLMREITSKQHERMAMAAAGLVMVMTGAVTALRLRGRLPLTVYLWSFFPALATVLTISSGQQMVEPMGNIGLVLLWGGVAALAVYSLAAYRIVRRH